jgi:hypothetical protein
MKCHPRLQPLAVRLHGVQLQLHYCKTICTSISSVMHALHTISSAGP